MASLLRTFYRIPTVQPVDEWLVELIAFQFHGPSKHMDEESFTATKPICYFDALMGVLIFKQMFGKQIYHISSC